MKADIAIPRHPAPLVSIFLVFHLHPHAHLQSQPLLILQVLSGSLLSSPLPSPYFLAVTLLALEQFTQLGELSRNFPKDSSLWRYLSSCSEKIEKLKKFHGLMTEVIKLWVVHASKRRQACEHRFI